jgi:hypothetical protein
MRVLTYYELQRYTLRELQVLLRKLLIALSQLPEDVAARETVLLNVHHVRIFIARHSRRHALCI